MTARERHILIDKLSSKGLSRRAACRWAGYSYVLHRPAQDAEWLEAMRKAAKANPRYGYRRVAIVSGLGFGCSWRLWQQHDFQLAP
jgi:putative transposase